MKKGFLFAILIFIFDRFLKQHAFNYVNGFFVFDAVGFRFVKNAGIALSLPVPVFISSVLSLVILFVIGGVSALFFLQGRTSPLSALSMAGIVLGGASNLYDRLFFGYVVDYFVVKFPFHDMAFNLSDVLIVFGVGFLLIVNTRRSEIPVPMHKQICIQNMRTYDKIAQTFSLTRKKPLWQEVADFKKYVRPGDRLLDIGCGSGRLVALFDGMDVEYVGIDNSTALLQAAEERIAKQVTSLEGSRSDQTPNMRRFYVQKGDMLTLDFPSEKFDMVFMIASLHHLPKTYHKQALKEARRVLKTNGLLCMTNFNLWKLSMREKTVWKYLFQKKPEGCAFKDVMTSWQNHPLYYYAFTSGELKRLCLNTGFRIIDCFYACRGKRAGIIKGNNLVLTAQK